MMSRNSMKLISNKYLTIFSRWKGTVDKSKVPQISEGDLEEQFIRGDGPGGQNVNKTNNCVLIKHLPTGIVIKCHHTRSQSQNRTIARQLLQEKLDVLINGEMSVSAQLKRIQEEKSKKREQRATQIREMKKDFKIREGIE